MGKFIQNESGIIIPIEEEQTETPEPVCYPIKEGWTFSLCGQVYYDSQQDWFHKKAFEDMYAVINSSRYWPGIGKTRADKCKDLLDQLAVEIMGGMPEDCEVYT